MAAVVFSKHNSVYRLCGRLHVCDIVSKKCFRTPGERFAKIGDTECKEVPSHLFAEALRDHLRNWDASEKEMMLWEHFFTAKRQGPFQPTIMELWRNREGPSYFVAKILGDVAEVSRLAQQVEETSEIAKEKIAVYGKNFFPISLRGFEWDTTQPLPECLEANKSTVKALDIDPKLIALFAQAPIAYMALKENPCSAQYFSRS